MGEINKIQKLIHRQAEVNRQIMILGTVLFAVGVMSIATIRITDAATDADTNIAQNVSAGALAITAPTELAFNDGGVGDSTVANIVTGDPITLADTRGNLDGWDVTGYFNTNFVKTGDTNIQMPINSVDGNLLRWEPASMTVENVTGNNASVNIGADANFVGINVENSLTLCTSNNGHADNGAGSYNVFNVVFNYLIPAGAEATDYTTDIRLTIA